MKKQILTILGATGTIGVNTLDVVARHRERFDVFALTGATQADRLCQQCLDFRPRFAVMTEADAAASLRDRLRAAGSATEVLSGANALIEVATAPEVSTLMAAIVGAAGLPATIAAARAGKRILLANKETLVVSGQLFMDAVHENGAELFPIDSEHSALHQSLPAEFNGDLDAAGVKTLWLTASGGPFRTWSRDQMARVTPEQAVAHPNWVMGRKISVDSASMMNKGLEVIEARWLFNAQTDKIRVLVHPQSIIHSMVEYRDGSVMAQLGTPDMRTPIAYGLGFPERIDAGVSGLDLMGSQLQFEAPDLERFPCLQLAFDALRTGGYAPAVLNAANEVAVDAFLNRRCGFADIPGAIEHALAYVPASSPGSLDDLLDADREARKRAGEFLAAKSAAPA
jgi:1-deoxy-D-xylulose-5-phosphate reductoisomerase